MANTLNKRKLREKISWTLQMAPQDPLLNKDKTMKQQVFSLSTIPRFYFWNNSDLKNILFKAWQSYTVILGPWIQDKAIIPVCVCAKRQRGSELAFPEATHLDSRPQVRLSIFFTFFWWWVQCSDAISQKNVPWKLECKMKLVFSIKKIIDWRLNRS